MIDFYPIQKTIKFKYTNYKGVTSIRTVEPVAIIMAHNEWHPEEQWMLRAYDMDKKAMRSFALKHCDFTVTEISVTSDVKEEE